MSEEVVIKEPVAEPVAPPAPAPAPGQADSGVWEKEKKGLLADIQKERQRYQTVDQERQKYQAELELERKRVQALSGVNPRNPAETEDAEIKAAFAAKFPHLAELTAEDIQTLRNLKGQQQQLQETTQNYWRNHGNQMVGRAETEVSELLGISELSDRQRKSLKREYISFLEDNEGFLDRHEAGDEKLITEFAKQFVDDWREPVRRSITSNEIQRSRPVPSGRGRSVNVGGKKKIDFSNAKEVEDAMVASFQDHGGSFGGNR